MKTEPKETNTPTWPKDLARHDFTIGDRSRGFRSILIRCDDGAELPEAILAAVNAHNAARRAATAARAAKAGGVLVDWLILLAFAGLCAWTLLGWIGGAE
jgi:hypothetical protein